MKKDRCGEIGFNSNGTKMVISKYNNAHDIIVLFEDYNYKVKTNYKAFKKGKVKCVYDRTVFGVGYIGEGKYKTVNEQGNKTNAYCTWLNMLKRVYFSKMSKKTITYECCEVCKEWLCYNNFAEWYYDNEYKYDENKLELDKDILHKNNKKYCPKYCLLVPKKINMLFVKSKSSRGDTPIGVKKVGNKYSSRFKKNGKEVHIGAFKTKEEAFLAYKKEKEKWIKEVAEKNKERIPEKVYFAMINYSYDIND
jgi:hypothetical protein